MDVDKKESENIKRVEFHQADIRVTVKVTDDDRSYGMKQFTFSLLKNTPQEWQAAMQQVNNMLSQLKVEEVL